MNVDDLQLRPASVADLAALQAIEAAADRMFDPMMDTSHWGTPPTGAERAASGGFILVAGEPVVGFAHVIELDGEFHLEQLAVHPDRGRRGIGTQLVYGAVQSVASRGASSLTLMTYADVPWNAPFYQTLGFEVIEPPPRLQPLIAHETEIGLDRGGRRVAMSRVITAGVTPLPAVSVIPIRDSDRGIEVFVQHRVHTMDFAPGMVVFPGGRVDPIDYAQPAELDDATAHDHAQRWHDSDFVRASDNREVAARVLVATGVREIAEETGVALQPHELHPWDEWTTPPDFPKRFHAHFYVAHLASDDPRAPQNTTTEALQSEWLPAAEVLDRGRGSDLQLMTPTRVILQELHDLGEVSVILGMRPVITSVHLDRYGTRPRLRHA